MKCITLAFGHCLLYIKEKNTLQPLKTINTESHLLHEYDNNSNHLGVREDSPSGPKSPQFNWGQHQQLIALASSFCYCWTKRLAVKTRCCSRGIRGEKGDRMPDTRYGKRLCSLSLDQHPALVEKEITQCFPRAIHRCEYIKQWPFPRTSRPVWKVHLTWSVLSSCLDL